MRLFSTLMADAEGSMRRCLTSAGWYCGLLVCFTAVELRFLAADDAKPAVPSEPAKSLTFETDILPIMQARCAKCHGSEKLEAGFDVRRRFTMVKGGDSGSALTIGKPDESLVLERIEKNEMPPPDEGRLDNKQKALLRQWILSGAATAKDPEEPLDETDTPSRISEDDRKFWSFQTPVRAPVPAVQAKDRVRNEVDAFLLQKLEAKNLTYNSEASKEVLLRRLCIDLLGLPPTLEQAEEFTKDTRSDAYDRLVDRLLDSPQYGERWARHWLDVAGYADSDGYLAADRLRPEAWRYRDYVIDAFNRDLGFDQFVREQLAGDELTDWRRGEEITPEVERQLQATGFLRNALDPTYPGYTEPNEIHQVLADTMQIVSSSLLGLTVQCARCHSHKFDPISQRDYYSLQAVFLGAMDPARWQPSEVRGVNLATEAQEARITERNKKVDDRIAGLAGSLAELTTHFQKKRVTEAFASLNHQLSKPYHTTGLDSAWTVSPAGTAKSWQITHQPDRVDVQSIDGSQGYALMRLTRPVALTREFDTSMVFSWQSQDGEPAANLAMQGLLLNLRDAAGNLVASAGYIDENNNFRGSPVSGIHTAEAPLGADLIDHYLKLHKQAVPPNDKTHALAANGTATVKIQRDTAGLITVQFGDGKITDSISAESKSLITTVEIEFRRYILQDQATFNGLKLHDFQLIAPPIDMPDQAQIEKLALALPLKAEQRSADQKLLIEKFPVAVPLTSDDLAGRYAAYKADVTKFKAAIASEEALKQSITRIRGLTDLDEKPTLGKIMRRGDHDKPGASVEANVPEVLAFVDFKYQPQAGYKTSGRRAAFARWLTDARNPLFARVQVNRIWARHFGRGLVTTQANFGRAGAKPTHPELLDWLATEFIRLGWSQKALHRLLVTTSAYRQTADIDATKQMADPDNILLSAWQPRRMEGEVLRDSLLAVAGTLNPQMGGPPAQVAAQGDGSVIDTDDPAGRKRSIYQIVRRSQHLTLLDLFDTPVMEVNCPERTQSIVPLQALAMLHGPAADRAAKSLADRTMAHSAVDHERIEFLYRLLFARSPRMAEEQQILTFLTEATQERLAGNATPTDSEKQAALVAAWKDTALVLLNSNEFVFVH
jgi:mono/diheme cytochrome c family protein